MRTLQLAEDGCAILPGVFSTAEVEELLAAIPPIGGRSAGSRDLHLLNWMREFATMSRAAKLAAENLGVEARVVRILFFDKQPSSNWKLPYHQDLTIALKSEAKVPGYGPWSVKEAIPHVQPPAELLQQMVAVRIHLDDCPAENGALRVLPGSHLSGRLSADQVDRWVAESEELVLEAGVGDVVLMRPLLLHASSPSSKASHRRVLHIEYCSAHLAPGLDWFLGWPVES